MGAPTTYCFKGAQHFFPHFIFDPEAWQLVTNPGTADVSPSQ